MFLITLKKKVGKARQAQALSALCGIKGHDLMMELCRPGCWLDLMILKVFPNLDGSLTLNTVP